MLNDLTGEIGLLSARGSHSGSIQ